VLRQNPRMLPRHHEPIVAIATAAGRGAVGIVRASGRSLDALILAVCGRPLAPRRASYLPFLDAAGAAIDQGLAIHFPAPASYTGEDVLELQAHGGPVLLQLLLARCLEAMPGLRLAGPGEFTERAYLNDKLDLAQAEAVADLIEASTEAAARSASRSLAGAFSDEIAALAEALLRLRLLVEATLDFPDEEIDFLEQADARGRLERIAAQLDAVLARARQGALLREGISVVIAGQPNVGKSSLLNALAGAELAIVTPIPGTTRDKVSQTIQIEGVPLHVIDTAGLREQAGDEVERIGIERSWDAVHGADAVLLVHDLTRLGAGDYDAGEAQMEARLAQVVAGERLLHVYNKADLAAPAPGQLALSARSGEGLSALRRQLLERVGWHAEAAGSEGVFMARARHLAALRRAREHVAAARAQSAAEPPALELLAEELRLAHDALGEITGRFTADDLLGEIFGRFCIGK
jgi:tRNA modification GTPase